MTAVNWDIGQLMPQRQLKCIGDGSFDSVACPWDNVVHRPYLCVRRCAHFPGRWDSRQYDKG